MNNVAKAFVSAVVYVHDNEATLPSFLQAVNDAMEQSFSSVELICVNDASTDASASVIEKLARSSSLSSMSVINMSFFHGRESAMRAGDDLAVGDYVIEFDNAVLDFDVSLIRQAFDMCTSGFDIVGVSPIGKRRLTSRLFYKAMNNSSDIANTLDTESFRVLSRRAMNRVESASKTIPYRKAVYANSGLPQITVQFTPSKEKKAARLDSSRKDGRYRLDVAVEALVLFTRTGYRVALGFALFMMAVALFMLVYSIVCYCAGITVAGWTTTALFISFGLFGVFGILTIVIKYLQIIVNLVFKKKPYSFESIERY